MLRNSPPTIDRLNVDRRELPPLSSRNFRATHPTCVRAFCLLLLLQSACSPTPIAVALSDDDSGKALVALQTAGVFAQRESDPQHEGKFIVQVTPADATTALAILHDEQLPARNAPGVADTLANSSSWLPSNRNEQAQLITAQAADLERTLRTIDGVVDARVHLALPQTTPLLSADLLPPDAKTATPLTASVLVKHRASAPNVTLHDVQFLVSGAITGLSPERVHVVFVAATRSAPQLAQSLVEVGPMVVTRSTARVARTVLGGLLALVALLALTLIWAWFRRPTRSAPVSASFLRS